MSKGEKARVEAPKAVLQESFAGSLRGYCHGTAGLVPAFPLGNLLCGR